MAGKRTALLIVTDTYLDGHFRALRAPRHDAAALAAVLGDPAIGGFAVETLVNRPADEVKRRVYRLFKEVSREDMVLCYFSGHGIKDDPGRLHLVATDTEWDALAVTALPAVQLREMIDTSRARQTVLWLDCCYSGAFPSGRTAKSGDRVDVVDQLAAHSGRGCAVMTASTAIQYSFEGDADPRATGALPPSVFTDAIVRGLRTGAADLNSDGLIDAAELYRYVYDEVQRSTPDQTPTRNDQVVGDLYIAQSNHGLPVDPALPLEIRQSLCSTTPRIRQAAIEELADLAARGDISARNTLARLSSHTNADLAQAARRALRPEQPSVSENVRPAPEEPAPQAPAPGPVKITPVPEPPAPDDVVDDVIVDDNRPYVVPRKPPLVLPPGVPSVNRAGGKPLGRIFGAADLSTTLTTDLGEPNSVAFSPDGSALVVADRGGLLLWGTGTWDMRPLRGDGRGYLRRASFNRSGDTMIALSDSGVHLWRTDTWEPKAILQVPHVRAAAFSPNGRHLVTAPDNDAARVWRTSDWQSDTKTTAAAWHILWAGVEYSPFGAAIALTWGPSVLIWHPAGGDEVLLTDNKTEKFHALAFTHHMLAAGGDAGDVLVWNTTDWTLRARLRGHKEDVVTMAFGPDGNTLATGGFDAKIRLWDVSQGRLRKTLSGHFGGVTGLSFSPDGSTLASSSRDGMVKLWPVRELLTR